MIIEIPGVGNVEFPDGMPMADIEAALAQYRPQETVERNPDGTYGQPPEGFVLNPATGQMEDMRSPNNPNIPASDTIGAIGAGGGQGITFGGGDEAAAAARAAAGGDYDYELARMREWDRRAKENHPWAYYPSLIAGAAASSVGAGRALGVNPMGQTLGGTMARGSGIGAVEGSIWGGLTGEGDAKARIANALKDAGIGAGVGFAAPAVVAGAAKAGNAVRDIFGGGFDAVIGRANQGRANRAIMETVKRAGRSADDIADDVARAAQEGQPEFRLMDATGKAGQRRASGVVRSGGDGAEELAQFLETRQLGQPERVGAFTDEAFGLRGSTAAKERTALNEARKAVNNANYDAARQAAGPVNLNNAIETIDGLMKRNPIVGDTALTKSEMGGRLAALRKQLSNEGEQLIDFDTVLNVKEDLGRVIGGIKRSGGDVPHDLAKVYGALDDALADASDAYRAANEAALAGRKVVGAVDEGAAMARPSVRSADTIPAFQAMTPDQQSAARIGYGDRALAKIEANSSPTANRAKVFGSPKARAEADAMALDPQLFRDRLNRETAMWDVQNRALGGSRTADNLADQGDLSAAADIGRAVRDGLTGRIGSALGTVANRVGTVATGQNEATRALIAKMLMSDDPKRALAAALRQETTSQGRRRVVEAITRALGREFLPTP